MILFNMKKKLKRDKFMKLVDVNAFWNKTATIPELKEMLNTLKEAINNYKYKTDKDFFIDGRRKTLKEMILTRETNERNIKESLFNFMEYVNCEYCSIDPKIAMESKVHPVKFMNVWDKYKKKGIICLEEKNEILEMINHIENEISKLN